MPRFTPRPLTIEAHRYDGSTLNLEGDFNRVIVNLTPGGRATVRTPGGMLPLNVGDWLVRDASGVVMPVGAGTFERTYEPAAVPVPELSRTLTLPLKTDARKLTHVR